MAHCSNRAGCSANMVQVLCLLDAVECPDVYNIQLPVIILDQGIFSMLRGCTQHRERLPTGSPSIVVQEPPTEHASAFLTRQSILI